MPLCGQKWAKVKYLTPNEREKVKNRILGAILTLEQIFGWEIFDVTHPSYDQTGLKLIRIFFEMKWPEIKAG